MLTCIRCSEEKDFMDDITTMMKEHGFVEHPIAILDNWCRVSFQKDYEADPLFKIQVIFQYCSCSNIKLPRVPRTDGKWRVTVIVNEPHTQHGGSNAFTVVPDVEKVLWNLRKEIHRGIKRFSESDRAWRELLHEMRDWP